MSQSFQQHFTLIQYIAKIFPRTVKPLTKKISLTSHLLVSNTKFKDVFHTISWQNKLHVFAEHLQGGGGVKGKQGEQIFLSTQRSIWSDAIDNILNISLTHYIAD